MLYMYRLGRGFLCKIGQALTKQTLEMRKIVYGLHIMEGKLRVTPEKRRAEMEEAADQVWPEEGE